MHAPCIPTALRKDRVIVNEFKMGHHIKQTALKDMTRDLLDQLVSMSTVKGAHVAGDGSLIVIYSDNIRQTGSPQGVRFSVSGGQIHTAIERAINRFARLIPETDNGFPLYL